VFNEEILGHNKIWGAPKFGGTAPEYPPGYGPALTIRRAVSKVAWLEYPPGYGPALTIRRAVSKVAWLHDVWIRCGCQ